VGYGGFKEGGHGREGPGGEWVGGMEGGRAACRLAGAMKEGGGAGREPGGKKQVRRDCGLAAVARRSGAAVGGVSWLLSPKGCARRRNKRNNLIHIWRLS
jgi:hypothetical protein